MFEQSQPESLLFSQSINEISYRRNQNLARVLFSLLPYVRQGVLQPGENNIRMFLSDQVYTASLIANGNLESGGVVFTSFGRWIKSILGNYLNNQKVRVRKSFRVEYEDQDLGDLVFNQTLLSASQPAKAAPKRPVKPLGVPSTQIPQEKISDVRPPCHDASNSGAGRSKGRNVLRIGSFSFDSHDHERAVERPSIWSLISPS